jgi:hypothetical protein
MLRLVDLNPVFVGAGGPGISDADGSPATPRQGVGLMFDCPCGKCEDNPCLIMFRNPLDGGPCFVAGQTPTWQREGDTFETLSTQPSILRNPAKGGCGWHGYITRGEILTC